MKSFSAGLDVSVIGAGNLKTLEKNIKAAGIELENLTKKTIEFEGREAKVFSAGVKGWKKLTKEKKDLVKATIEALKYEGQLAGTYKEIDPTIKDVTKHLRQLERAELASSKATAMHAKNMANLAARLESVRKAAQTRRDDAQRDRDLIRERDRPEMERRQREREQAEIDRHNRRIQASQQQHRLAMQRINAYNSGGGMFGGGILPQGVINGGIAKVVAYDALRRTLTNIYQIVGQIGDKMQDWVFESLKLNDEMRRAQTVFTGLGLIGMRNSEGGMLSIEQAEKSSKTSDKQALAESEVASKQLMNKLVAVSLEAGEELNEVVSSARQLSTDLLNKAKQPDWIKNQGKYQETIVAMTELGAAFKSQDPQGRKMGWHMVAIQELFSGSSGSKKDTGMQNVRSMMLREGIKIREADATAISKAVNSGKITDAKDLIVKILERSGTSMTSLRNQQYKTLMPNLTGSIGAMQQIALQFTDPLYDHLQKSFRRIMKALTLQLKDQDWMFKFTKAGEVFNKALDPVLKTIRRAVDFLINDPDKVVSGLKVLSAGFGDAVQIFLSLSKGVFNFFMGFLGIADGKRLDLTSYKQFAAQFEASGVKAGIVMRDATQKFIDLSAPLTTNIIPAVSELTEGLKELWAVIETIGTALKLIDQWTGVFTDLSTSIVAMVMMVGVKIREALSWIPGNSIDQKGLSEDRAALEIFKKENMSTSSRAILNLIDRFNPANPFSIGAIAEEFPTESDKRSALRPKFDPANSGKSFLDLAREQAEKNSGQRETVKSQGITYTTADIFNGMSRMFNFGSSKPGSNIIGRPSVMPTPAAQPSHGPSNFTGAADPSLIARVAELQKRVKITGAKEVAFDHKVIAQHIKVPNKPIQLTGQVNVKSEGVRIGNINVTTNDPEKFVNGLKNYDRSGNKKFGPYADGMFFNSSRGGQ